MIQYEVWYVETRYRDLSRTFMNASGLKSIAFQTTDDQEAIIVAQQLLRAPSDDPLVDRRVLNKLVRIIEIN